MSANISRAELALLNCLQERSGISGGRIGLDPKAIQRALGISVIRLAQDAASLAALGLAGVRHFRTGADDKPSGICSAVWVTTKGEEYLRRSRVTPNSA